MLQLLFLTSLVDLSFRSEKILEARCSVMRGGIILIKCDFYYLLE